MDQLGEGAAVFVIQLPFHEVPYVFNRIQIQTVPRPVNDLEWLIPQELDPFGGMAGAPVMQEVGGTKCPSRREPTS
jgi:hypothetical protein